MDDMNREVIKSKSLEELIRLRLMTKRANDGDAILLMGHQVIGHPSCEVNAQILDVFVDEGVDLVELQIPFSDPVADGPLFVKANQAALEDGMTVEKALSFIERQVEKLSIPVLVMTYFNIVHAYGAKEFVERMERIGVKGLIIPDAPFDVVDDFWMCCKSHGIAMIPVSTAFTSEERVARMIDAGGGFVYHVPRSGVTGTKTKFDTNVLESIRNVAVKSHLPLGVGFGIQSSEDIAALKGTADIAIMGSVFLKTFEKEGIRGIMTFLRNVRLVAESPVKSAKHAYDRLMAGESLNATEASMMLEGMFSGELDAFMVAGALTQLRSKGETAEELKGFVDGLRKRISGLPMPSGNVLDNCGTGGDGHGTINISTTAMFVAAAAGVKVAKHGNRAMSGKSGAADVLEILGVKIDTDAQTVKECIDTCGIGFYYAPVFHEAMKTVGPIRKSLGFRTIFNLAGPLANPASPKRQLVGVYDASVMDTVANALLSLGVEKGLVVHGTDGLDEISISSETKALEISCGKITERVLTPEDFGFRRLPMNTIKGGDALYNAVRLIRILNGQGNEGESAAIAMNAGAAIYLHGLADSMEKGVEKAREIINKGIGFEKLVDLRMISNGHSLEDRLSRIVHTKQLRLLVQKSITTPEEMLRAAHATMSEATISEAKVHEGFESRLRKNVTSQTGVRIHVIAEAKKASPSKGLIRGSYDPVEIASAYQSAGASAMSVLTEEDHFKGSSQHLAEVRKAVELPLLRKDFILDPYQIHEAKVLGASAVLLIAALLDESTISAFIKEAGILGMDALVEVHNEEELMKALEAGSTMIGINNRNLRTFEVDIDTSLRLVGMLPPEVVAISESGIRTTEDMKRLADAGFDAVLVGEQLMRQESPGSALKKLLGSVSEKSLSDSGPGIVKCCGLRRFEDIQLVNEAMPDFAGFVLAPGKRKVELGRLGELIMALDPSIKPVAVLVDPSADLISSVADMGIKVIQLHGNECPDSIRDARMRLDREGHEDVAIWKAYRFNAEYDDAHHESTLMSHLDNPAIERVIVDAYDKSAAGGTGVSFDWGRLHDLGLMDRIILAGGLSGENVKDVIDRFAPFGVDASSGIEKDGFKEKTRVDSFVNLARVGFKSHCEKIMKKNTES